MSEDRVMKKPIPLRIIFILYALKVLLAFGFYFLFSVKDISIEKEISQSIILYTAFGYVLTFAMLVFFILKRNLMGVRATIVVDFVISLPSKAFIGIVFAIIAMALTFHKKVRAYFSQ